MGPSNPAEKKIHAAARRQVVSRIPQRDADKLLRRFMQQAYPRPVEEKDVKLFAAVIQNAMKSGENFTDAMIAGYTAVLSSPAFLYLREKPGRLDDLALAEKTFLFSVEFMSRPGASRIGGERINCIVLTCLTGRPKDC